MQTWLCVEAVNGWEAIPKLMLTAWYNERGWSWRAHETCMHSDMTRVPVVQNAVTLVVFLVLVSIFTCVAICSTCGHRWRMQM